MQRRVAVRGTPSNTPISPRNVGGEAVFGATVLTGAGETTAAGVAPLAVAVVPLSEELVTSRGLGGKLLPLLGGEGDGGDESSVGKGRGRGIASAPAAGAKLTVD